MRISDWSSDVLFRSDGAASPPAALRPEPLAPANNAGQSIRYGRPFKCAWAHKIGCTVAEIPSVDNSNTDDRSSSHSPNGRERVRSMRFDRPVSVARKSASMTVTLPVVEDTPAPAKPLSARDQVQQLDRKSTRKNSSH